jgi:hypothetical protein
MVKFVAAVLSLVLVGFYQETLGQRSSIKAIVEVPLQFGVGYEGRIGGRFSAGGSIGVLTAPNSNIILEYFKWIGIDQKLVAIIDDAFQVGVVGKGYVNINLGRNYFGVFGQAIGATATDVNPALYEDYFNVKMTDYPYLAGKTGVTEKNLLVRTRLYQAGVHFGHRFPLKNDRLAINVEVGLSANIGSKSSVESEVRDLTKLNELFDKSLGAYYRDYAYIPSGGIMLVYKLKKSEQ